MLKDLLKQRSKCPTIPSKTMIDQIIKGYCIALYNIALLAEENAALRTENQKETPETQSI